MFNVIGFCVFTAISVASAVSGERDMAIVSASLAIVHMGFYLAAKRRGGE